MSSPRVEEEKCGIANNPDYCGKVLEIDKGKRCSLHFHKLKLESFYLRRGKLKVRVKESPDAAAIESSNSMLESVSMSLWGLVHQMEAVEGKKLTEVSTQHF